VHSFGRSFKDVQFQFCHESPRDTHEHRVQERAYTSGAVRESLLRGLPRPE